MASSRVHRRDARWMAGRPVGRIQTVVMERRSPTDGGFVCRPVKQSAAKILECRCRYCGFKFAGTDARALKRIEQAHRRGCRKAPRLPIR